MIDLDLLDNKYNEACNIFGKETVEEVIESLRFIGDPNELYTLYKDHGQYSYMECVVFLYLKD